MPSMLLAANWILRKHKLHHRHSQFWAKINPLSGTPVPHLTSESPKFAAEVDLRKLQSHECQSPYHEKIWLTSTL